MNLVRETMTILGPTRLDPSEIRPHWNIYRWLGDMKELMRVHERDLSETHKHYPYRSPIGECFCMECSNAQ